MIGYLDDLTVAGPAETVARDVGLIIQIGCSMGLQLNVSKCELICVTENSVTDDTDPMLSSFKIVQSVDAPLLGDAVSRHSSRLCVVREMYLVISHYQSC
jgi:hypothetical protein